MELKEYLKKNNISAYEFSRKVGITPVHLYSILRKARKASYQVAMLIKEQTNSEVDTSQLYGRKPLPVCPACKRILPRSIKIQLEAQNGQQ